MKLRTKAMLIFFSTFIPLILFFYISIHHIVLREHEILEEQTVRQDILRTGNAICGEMDALDTLNADWAKWDDTYLFALNTNEQFISANLMDETFTSLKLDFIIIANMNQELVYAKMYDYTLQQEIPLPPGVAASVQQYCASKPPATNLEASTGFLSSSSNLYMISIMPILTSTEEGPPHGLCMMGRRFNTALINRISHTTDLPLEFAMFSNPGADMDILAAMFELTQTTNSTHEQPPILIKAKDASTIRGYSLLYDLNNHPVMTLRIKLPRKIYQQGVSALNYVAFSLLGMGLVFGLMIMFLWQKHVLS
ncbi:MAG: CHASE4 domain-containing protein, partial [Lentisphaerota bacterium]